MAASLGHGKRDSFFFFFFGLKVVIWEIQSFFEAAKEEM